MDFKDSASGFRKAGVVCKDEISDQTWKESYHPSYAQDLGICAGFKSIPTWISCNATPPLDGKTRRLCSCIDKGIGFYFVKYLTRLYI